MSTSRRSAAAAGVKVDTKPPARLRRDGTAMLMSSLGVGMVQFFTVKERWSQGRARCQDFCGRGRL